MKCPKCSGVSGVTNTAILAHIVWRTRKCKSCGYAWDTSEVEDEPPVSVDMIKREKNDE